MFTRYEHQTKIVNQMLQILFNRSKIPIGEGITTFAK